MEYIKREKVMALLCNEIIGEGDYYNWKDDMQDEIRGKVARIPVEDVTPIRHGKWIMPLLMADGHIHAECSNCHKIRIYDDYCSACGAIMDLEDMED